MSDLSDKAKEILHDVIYITIATVTPDGTPWNTPVYSAYDEDYNFYWVSDKNGQHSKNIRDNENVFIAVYDSNIPEGTGVGVYIKAKAIELSGKDKITKGLTALYTRKNKDSQKRTADEFLGSFPRRVYKATPEKCWINGAGEINGNFIDIRTEINLTG